MLQRPRKRTRPPARFVVVRENRSAVRAMRSAACRCVKSRSTFVFMHGLPGTGKSHLAQWLLRTAVRKSPTLIARLIALHELLRLVEGSRGRDALREFRDCDLLIVEDLQHAPPGRCEFLTALLDDRLRRGRTTIVTAGAGPVTLTALSPRLISRLAGGLVVGIEPLGRESRLRIARTLCAERGLNVEQPVLNWLTRSPAGGVRSIVGDVQRLERVREATPGPITMTAIGPMREGDEDATMMDRLIAQVARLFDVKQKQLLSRDRRRQLLWPRQVGMYMARQVAGLSLQRVGDYFGGYDHTTVLHACRKVEEKLHDTPLLRQQLTELSALTV